MGTISVQGLIKFWEYFYTKNDMATAGFLTSKNDQDEKHQKKNSRR